MIKKISFFAIIIAIAGLIMVSNIVLAQVVPADPLEKLEGAGAAVYGEAKAEQMSRDEFIQETVGKLIVIFLGALGAIFLILMIYGGFLWMTAAGNEERVTKAKSVLTRAIIGFIIVVASYGITHFILQAVMNSMESGTG